jgi:hypothetical protein
MVSEDVNNSYCMWYVVRLFKTEEMFGASCSEGTDEKYVMKFTYHITEH